MKDVFANLCSGGASHYIWRESFRFSGISVLQTWYVFDMSGGLSILEETKKWSGNWVHLSCSSSSLKPLFSTKNRLDVKSWFGRTDLVKDLGRHGILWKATVSAAPSWKCESAFSILSQIRHRFHVAIVLFHDGIVAAAAAAAIIQRLMLRPGFRFQRS